MYKVPAPRSGGTGAVGALRRPGGARVRIDGIDGIYGIKRHICCM
jgi:hypothetical protein